MTPLENLMKHHSSSGYSSFENSPVSAKEPYLPVKNNYPAHITPEVTKTVGEGTFSRDKSIDTADLDNMFSNSPFFDPGSPFIPPPYSPSSDLNPMTPAESTTINPSFGESTQSFLVGQYQSPSTNSKHTPPSGNSMELDSSNELGKNQSPAGNSIQTPPSGISMELDSSTGSSLHLNSPISTMQPYLPVNYFLDTRYNIDVASGNNSFDTVKLKGLVNFNSFDPIHADTSLDQLLNSNDTGLLQEIHNTTEQLQIMNNTTQMKTKTYLAPSHFLQFVYNEVETYTKERTQRHNILNEFDVLLDNILKEYNIVTDVNNRSC